MKENWHTLRCDLLVKGNRPDRFYMDMSVYEVRPYEFDDSRRESSLIWRGLYLAVQTQVQAGRVSPTNPFLNFWN